jgi:hypothetical protein
MNVTAIGIIRQDCFPTTLVTAYVPDQLVLLAQGSYRLLIVRGPFGLSDHFAKILLKRMLGDKAYDSAELREELDEPGTWPVIPNRASTSFAGASKLHSTG